MKERYREIMENERAQSKLMLTFRRLSICKTKTQQEMMEEAALAMMANFGAPTQMMVSPRMFAQLKDLSGK